jgi:hypothetical protein
MSWQRRARNKPGPLAPISAPTGDSPTGAAIQVELLLDGLWTDITSRVMTREGSGKIQLSRGEPNEGSQTDPGVCRMELQNRDGLFSTRNPTSPYYGKLARNQQLRVSVPSGNDKNVRFWGEVASWPQSWDPTGKDVGVMIEASGVLRRLGQNAAPIGSALKVDLLAGDQLDLVLGFPGPAPVLVAYWPCEDGALSTSIGSSVVGVPAMTITGTPTLASFSGFVCSDPLPVMGSASFSAAVPAYTQPISTGVTFLLAVPAGGAADGQVLCSFTTTGTAVRWELYYSAAGSGGLGLRAISSSGSSLMDSLTPSQINGQLLDVAIVLLQDGADIFATTNVYAIGSSFVSGPGGLISSSQVGIITSVTLAPGRGLTATAMGHLHIQTYQTDAFNGVDWTQTLTAHAGESADDRIYRLLLSMGVTAHQIGNDHVSVVMGVQRSGTLISLVQDAVLAEGGILYELTNGFGLGYRTRESLENQAPAVTLDYALGQLANAPVPIDDDRYARNDITVSRTNGSSSRAIQQSGPLSVQQPPAGVGTYPVSVTVNVAADSNLPSQAGWRLHLGTVDEARYPQISVNLAHSTFASNPFLREQILAVRPGDRIVVANPPAWLPPDQISQLVIGFSETIDQFQHRITFNCVPESPYRTALLEDVLLSRLDSGGSQVAADALATDTTLKVTTTSGPLWTTSAADWPFDVRIAGEQITVTAVSGASNPQTFTVTRSVNGVVKPLPIGADVRLNQPMTLSL